MVRFLIVITFELISRILVIINDRWIHNFRALLEFIGTKTIKDYILIHEQ